MGLVRCKVCWPIVSRPRKKLPAQAAKRDTRPPVPVYVPFFTCIASDATHTAGANNDIRISFPSNTRRASCPRKNPTHIAQTSPKRQPNLTFLVLDQVISERQPGLPLSFLPLQPSRSSTRAGQPLVLEQSGRVPRSEQPPRTTVAAWRRRRRMIDITAVILRFAIVTGGRGRGIRSSSVPPDVLPRPRVNVKHTAAASSKKKHAG